MPTKVLVSDTNIWIDLHRSGLLEAAFHLPHAFATTDFVWRELHTPPGPALTEMGLRVETIDSDEVQALLELRHTLNNSSLADVSCYFLAWERGWTLLTGDGALRRSARQAEIEVRGVLWLLDELQRNRVLTEQRLAEALISMLEQGARLPHAECQMRLDSWRRG